MFKWCWFLLVVLALAALGYMFRMENISDGMLYRNRWTGLLYQAYPSGYVPAGK
jgi:hypothetical protein